MLLSQGGDIIKKIKYSLFAYSSLKIKLELFKARATRARLKPSEQPYPYMHIDNYNVFNK